MFIGDPAHGRSSGAGVGLPIARWIAGSQGGDIRLEPAPGGGTAAVVTLPLEDA